MHFSNTKKESIKNPLTGLHKGCLRPAADMRSISISKTLSYNNSKKHSLEFYIFINVGIEQTGLQIILPSDAIIASLRVFLFPRGETKLA